MNNTDKLLSDFVEVEALDWNSCTDCALNCKEYDEICESAGVCSRFDREDDRDIIYKERANESI